MMFGPSSSSGLFAGSREASGYGLGAASGGGAASSSTAASASVPHAITAVAATPTLRGAFVACAGPGRISVVAVKRAAADPTSSRQATNRSTQGGLAAALQPPAKLIASPAASHATASPAVASCIAVTPIRGSMGAGRTAASFDRAAVVSGSACGTVEVFEASTAAGDASSQPDLRRLSTYSVASLLGTVEPNDAARADISASPAIHAVAGASSAAHGVSWIAIATRSMLMIHEATALDEDAPEPLAVFDGCCGAFHASYSGATIVSVCPVLPSAAESGAEGSSSGAHGEDDDADSDADAPAATTTRIAAAWGDTSVAHGGVEGSVKDVPAFSVTWTDGTVHTIRGVLLPVVRGKQPVEFYAARSVDPRMVFTSNTLPSVMAASSSLVPARSNHYQVMGTPGPCLRTVAVSVTNECYVAVYPPAAGDDCADADDQRTPTPLCFRVPATSMPNAVAAVDTEEAGGRGLGTAVVAVMGAELVVSRWERSGGSNGRGSMRALRPVAAFDGAIGSLTVLPGTGDRAGSYTTAPSTPASRTSAGATSSGVSRNAGSASGPVAIAAVGSNLHFVLL